MGLDRLSDQIIAGAVDGIAVVNEEGLIVEWNQAAGQITGIPRAEAVGQPFWDIQMRLLPFAKRRLELREQYRGQILEACRTGSRW